MNIRHFKSAADFRKWLEKNHDKVSELWVGFYKKATGKKSISYAESVDQALCFGWIDGVRKGVDEVSYTNRFTPRKQKSTWSKFNINRMRELEKLGLIHPSGLEAFQRMNPKTSGYSLKERPEKIDPVYLKKFKTNKKAWVFFQAQAPWYKRNAMWWVTSAKQEETRARRFAKLIEDSQKETRLSALSTSSKQK